MGYPLGQRLRELPGPLLLTGHTGFKGTWMAFLLEHLNVPVVGYSLPPEKDSLFDRAGRTSAIPEVFADVRDYKTLEAFIDEHKPSTIIHMAAQPLVLKSYENPRETFDINIMGTVNVLDIAFKQEYVKAITIVTTDKVYRNDNSDRAFVESDPLEGKDPYSASKVGTEAVVSAWQQIAKVSGGPFVTSVRAGNVIGGGDFAADRLIPDLVRGLIFGNVVEIRNPKSTRPWQHVLDPLIGYLRLLEEQIDFKGEGHLNFGPNVQKITVETAALRIQGILRTVGPLEVRFSRDTENDLESRSLSLNSNLASKTLNWFPICPSEVALQMTANWWVKVLKNERNVSDAINDDLVYHLERIIEK